MEPLKLMRRPSERLFIAKWCRFLFSLSQQLCMNVAWGAARFPRPVACQFFFQAFWCFHKDQITLNPSCYFCFTPLPMDKSIYTLQGLHTDCYMWHFQLWSFHHTKWSNEPMVPFYFSLKKQNKNMLKQFQIWPLGKQNATPRWQWPKMW